MSRRARPAHPSMLVGDPSAGLCNPGLHAVAHGQALDPKRLPWHVKEPPYWANHEFESDHDSAIYAELDKHSRGGVSDGGTPRTRSPTRRATPNGEGPPGYSVHLKPVEKEEDVYTHV